MSEGHNQELSNCHWLQEKPLGGRGALQTCYAELRCAVLWVLPWPWHAGAWCGTGAHTAPYLCLTLWAWGCVTKQAVKKSCRWGHLKLMFPSVPLGYVFGAIFFPQFPFFLLLFSKRGCSSVCSGHVARVCACMCMPGPLPGAERV